MNELLTIDEMRVRYLGEWLLVEDLETTASLSVTRAPLIWRSPDRDEAFRGASELHPIHPAILSTGELPERAAIVR